jgi:hypothetical protein
LGGVSLKTAVGRWGFTKDSREGRGGLGKQRVEVTLRGNNWVRYLLEVEREGRGVWGNNAWRLR